jgi:phage baseplate assembly protein V
MSQRKMLEFINQVVSPLRNRVMMLIGRAVLEAVKDSTGIQSMRLSLLKNEVRDNVERFQEFGMTSTPLPGAEAVVIFPFGNREHGLVIAIDDRRSRPKDIPPGGAALYSADATTKELKQVLKVLPDGTIEIGKGTIEKIVNGETFKTLFNTHTHVDSFAQPTLSSVPQMSNSELSSKVKAVI